MATVSARRIATVVGAAVADAAAQPLHWNYKKDEFDAFLAGKDEVEFWEPSHNPFYNIATGKHSCYGDQAEVILKSLAHCKGVNITHLKDEHYKKFGPESEYENESVNKAQSQENSKLSMPISTPWRHGSIKEFLKNYKANKEKTGSETDQSIDCVAKIAPVVALFAGRPELLEKAESVIRVTQESDVAVANGLAAARLLEHFILHGPDPDAINAVIGQLSDPQRKWPTDLDKTVAGQMRQVLDKRGMSHVTAVRDAFKMNCEVPGNFQSALHGVLTGTDYVTAVRQTTRAGGCNCSRSALIGACLAAQYGIDVIPESWRKRTIGYEQTFGFAEQLSKLCE